MSAYTTTKITRQAAQIAIFKEIMSCDNDMLERLLDELILERRLRRAQIVCDGELNDNDLIVD